MQRGGMQMIGSILPMHAYLRPWAGQVKDHSDCIHPSQQHLVNPMIHRHTRPDNTDHRLTVPFFIPSRISSRSIPLASKKMTMNYWVTSSIKLSPSYLHPSAPRYLTTLSSKAFLASSRIHLSGQLLVA